MQFYDYLASNNLDYSEAARQLNISNPSTIRSWCLPFLSPGAVVPSSVNLLKILLWSGGAVTPNDWFASFVEPIALMNQNREAEARQVQQIFDTLDADNGYHA